jgi:hypothetical protein
MGKSSLKPVTILVTIHFIIRRTTPSIFQCFIQKSLFFKNGNCDQNQNCPEKEKLSRNTAKII